MVCLCLWNGLNNTVDAVLWYGEERKHADDEPKDTSRRMVANAKDETQRGLTWTRGESEVSLCAVYLCDV